MIKHPAKPKVLQGVVLGLLPNKTKKRGRKVVVDYVNHYRVSAYDETTQKGLLRHIYVRRGVVFHCFCRIYVMIK